MSGATLLPISSWAEGPLDLETHYYDLKLANEMFNQDFFIKDKIRYKKCRTIYLLKYVLCLDMSEPLGGL